MTNIREKHSLLVCEALRRTEPLAGNSPEEVDKFYKALCANAGLPDPHWMATKAYEVAASLLAKSPIENTLLGNVMKAHCDALKYRCDHNPTYFPLALVTTDTLMDVLESALPATSYYNLRTRQPDSFDPAKVDGITVHSILLQAVGEVLELNVL